MTPTCKENIGFLHLDILVTLEGRPVVSSRQWIQNKFSSIFETLYSHSFIWTFFAICTQCKRQWIRWVLLPMTTGSIAPASTVFGEHQKKGSKNNLKWQDKIKFSRWFSSPLRFIKHCNRIQASQLRLSTLHFILNIVSYLCAYNQSKLFTILLAIRNIVGFMSRFLWKQNMGWNWRAENAFIDSPGQILLIWLPRAVNCIVAIPETRSTIEMLAMQLGEILISSAVRWRYPYIARLMEMSLDSSL